jgi:hypothetical protein
MVYRTKSDSESDIKTIVDLTPAQIYRYCLVKIIDATHLDIQKYHMAVGTLESLLSDKLKNEYLEAVKRKEEELQKNYKDYKHAEKENYIFELDKFKLSLLYVLLKRDMPEEIELEIPEVEKEAENEKTD